MPVTALGVFEWLRVAEGSEKPKVEHVPADLSRMAMVRLGAAIEI